MENIKEARFIVACRAFQAKNGDVKPGRVSRSIKKGKKMREVKGRECGYAKLIPRFGVSSGFSSRKIVLEYWCFVGFIK